MRPMTRMPSARFGLGQIVRHRDADFRGVVVDVDPHFLGGPLSEGAGVPDQPFYHVLAIDEGGGYMAYAAEDALEHDPDLLKVCSADERRLFTMDSSGRHAPKAHAIH